MAEPPICGDCTVFIADENVLKSMGDTVNHCPKHAEADKLRDSLTWALEELQKAYGAVWEKNDWEHYRPVVEARRTLRAARAGGA